MTETATLEFDHEYYRKYGLIVDPDCLLLIIKQGAVSH